MPIAQCFSLAESALLRTFGDTGTLFILFRWEIKNHTWEVTEALRPAIITLDWQRKNKTVFKSVNYAGYIGILTAVKPVCSYSIYSLHKAVTVDFCHGLGMWPFLTYPNRACYFRQV